jgi:DNA-binding transcriptional LysR family regulator
LNVERLRVLHAVAVTGSVRSAAASLHVTSSAASQQLARLESEIGQPLLERRGRGVRLTDAARLLVEHTTRLLAQLEQAEAELAAHSGAVAGRLTVAAFATAARGLCPAALRSLRDRHPELQARLVELEPDAAIPALARGDVDVAIVQDWTDAPLSLPAGLTRRHLLDDPFDVAVPADHPIPGTEPVALTELADEEWISWSDGQICHDWLVDTFRAHGLDTRIAHTASEHSTQLALVAAGLGVAVVPRLGRGPALPGVRFLTLVPRPRRRIAVLWRVAAARRPAVAEAVRAVSAAAGADEGGDQQAEDQ